MKRLVVGAAVLNLLVSGCASTKSHDRDPAAFVAISDSETPASDIYADETTESLSAGKKTPRTASQQMSSQASRLRKSAPNNSNFVTALAAGPSESEMQRRTGIPTVRSRAVILASGKLIRSHGHEMSIKIDLFPDVAPIFVLKVTSGFEVNEGMHSGFAPDDPSSSISLTMANQMVSGFIKYRGKEYRIIPDPERGLHYIVEVRRN